MSVAAHDVGAQRTTGVPDDQMQRRCRLGDAPGGNRHVSAVHTGCHAVLDGVLDEGLQHQRRQRYGPQLRGYVDADPQPLLEPFVLDVEIMLDQFQFPSERGEFPVRPQHPAQQARQPQQRPQRARRRRLNQITDGCQGVEEKVRVDLCP